MIGQLKRIVELNNLDKLNRQESVGNLIVFTSGKGGAGKSVLSLNMAYSLSSQGKKVLYADLDLNFANAHILLNMIPPKNIKDYFEGRSLIKNIITKVDKNLFLLPGNSGAMEINGFIKRKIESLINELKKISVNYDFVFIDTGQINDLQQMEFLLNSDLIVLITSPEPTAVMDAYVIVKMLNKHNCGDNKFVIVNKCSDEEECRITFNNINTASEHFLNEKLNLLGYVNFDSLVYKSITSQKLLMKENSNSIVYRQISELSVAISEFIQVANIPQS